jgi:hypothetical protein
MTTPPPPIPPTPSVPPVPPVPPIPAVPSVPPVPPVLNAGPADDVLDPRIRESRSPLEGGLGLALNMLSALVLITYTLIPLPGQRDIGWWNYVIAGVCFLGSIVLSAAFEELDARRVRLYDQAGDR